MRTRCDARVSRCSAAPPPRRAPGRAASAARRPGAARRPRPRSRRLRAYARVVRSFCSSCSARAVAASASRRAASARAARFFERGAFLRPATCPRRRSRCCSRCCASSTDRDAEPEREALGPRRPQRRRVEREITTGGRVGGGRRRGLGASTPRASPRPRCARGTSRRPLAERLLGHERPPQLARRRPGEERPAVESVQRPQRGGHIADVELAQHVGRDLDHRQQQRIGHRNVDAAVEVGRAAAHSGRREAADLREIPTSPNVPGRDATFTLRNHAVRPRRDHARHPRQRRHDRRHRARAEGHRQLRASATGCAPCSSRTRRAASPPSSSSPAATPTSRRVMEQLAPIDDAWEHNERNSDTNGHSHVRAGMIGPSVTVPFNDGELASARSSGSCASTSTTGPASAASSCSCSASELTPTPRPARARSRRPTRRTSGTSPARSARRARPLPRS